MYLAKDSRLPIYTNKKTIVYTVLESWDDARLSGVGERRQFCDVIPIDSSINVDISESTVDAKWVQIYLMKSHFSDKYPPRPPLTPQPLWGFPLHCSCLQLLWSLNPHLDRQDYVRALFHLCRSQPVFLGVMKWGHDYGGILPFHPNESALLPGEEPQQHEFSSSATSTFICDPSDESILDILTQNQRLEMPKSSEKQNGSLNIDPHSTDSFRQLPSELLLQIFCELQSNDVVALRVASRVCAHIPLYETFWLSRFWPGREYCHLQPLISHAQSQSTWRALYIRAKCCQNTPAMINRKRVWTLACHINNMVQALLSCSAGNLVTVNPSDTQFPEQVEDELSWNHIGGFIYHLKMPFAEGSRILREGTVTFNDPLREISVYLVQIYDKTYVSGLRLILADGQVTFLGYYDLGLKSHTICWAVEDPNIGDYLAGFHVAVDPRGIRGLRAVSRLSKLSPWVGDHMMLPKKSIIFPNHNSVYSIRGGFDVRISIFSSPFHSNILLSVGLETRVVRHSRIRSARKPQPRGFLPLVS